MELITTSFLILFCLLGVFDGIYFHIYKYQLHLHESSQREHRIHTARAFVFVPLSILLFVFDTGGLLLLAGIGLVILDLALELVDILEERVSRKPLGGISSEESAIHVFASCFKFAAIVLVLAGKDPQAFLMSSRLILHTPELTPLSIVGSFFALGCLAGGTHSIMIDEGAKLHPSLAFKEKRQPNSAA